MACPSQYREMVPGLPSIRPAGVDLFQGPRYRDAGCSGTPALSIPGMERRLEAPPPLPPPRELPIVFSPSPSHEMRERQEQDHRFALRRYGSASSSAPSERPSSKRTDYSGANTDDGHSSHSSFSTDRSLDSFPSEFGLYHSKLVIQSPADVLSDNMKRRLDPFCAPDSKNLYAPDGRFSSTSSPPLQLPIHPRPPLQSSSRVTNSPPSASLSPRSGAFPFSQHAASGSRSPLEAIDSARALRVPRKNSDGATYSVTPCFDYHGGEGMEMDDASPLKRLCIEDGQGKARRRRRITGSPLDDSALHPAAGQGDSVPPQQEFGRRSPSFARLQITSQPSSVVTARPGGPGSPNGYHMSNSSYPPWGLAATGRRSPGGYSAGESRHSSTSPYTKTVPLSTTTTVAAAVPAQCSSAHARSAPGSSPRKLAEVPKPAWTKLQGFLMCECCPKKPKKFETEEELRAHAAEKQYGCNFCGNRFKNKNEAERHQNSLHVRRHSWSCSALSGYDRAFHDSTTRPGEADTCGYCGEEFARSGPPGGSSSSSSSGGGGGGNTTSNSSNGAAAGGCCVRRHVTEADWKERIRHLEDMHKFRECNSSKKFYRADHFRQHLKHSHAGTSGKWTNMLENACMMDEDPTPR